MYNVHTKAVCCISGTYMYSPCIQLQHDVACHVPIRKTNFLKMDDSDSYLCHLIYFTRVRGDKQSESKIKKLNIKEDRKTKEVFF
jgi:hypothetical protein